MQYANASSCACARDSCHHFGISTLVLLQMFYVKTFNSDKANNSRDCVIIAQANLIPQKCITLLGPIFVLRNKCRGV